MGIKEDHKRAAGKEEDTGRRSAEEVRGTQRGHENR